MMEYPTHEFDDPAPTTSSPLSDAPSSITFTEQFEALQKDYQQLHNMCSSLLCQFWLGD